MKTNTIIIRISEDLKNQLITLSAEKNKSLSELVRIIIEDFIKNSEFTNTRMQGTAVENDIVHTKQFTDLVFWIFDKKRNPENSETDEFYYQHIETILTLEKHPHFKADIMKELKKVLLELNLVLQYSYEYGEFKFAKQGNHLSFNYELFSEFYYGYGYDEEGNKIFI